MNVADLKLILYVVGSVLITSAAGLVLLPAAFLCAGVACFGAVWLLR